MNRGSDSPFLAWAKNLIFHCPFEKTVLLRLPNLWLIKTAPRKLRVFETLHYFLTNRKIVFILTKKCLFSFLAFSYAT